MTEELVLKLRQVAIECRSSAERADDPLEAKSLRGVADDVDGRLFELLLAQQAKLDGLAAAQRFFSKLIARSDPTIEHFWVAHVDSSLRCLRIASYEGDATGVELPTRAILLDAIEFNSTGLVLAHNHPSGDAHPSPSDLAATRKLVAVVEPLDCTVLDHLIFAGDSCTSFRQTGLL